MTTPTCSHGLAQQSKFGTEKRDDLDICLGCGLPTADSVLRQRVSASESTEDSTPAARARAARAAGASFFEIQLEIAESSRDVRFLESDSGSRSERQHGQALGEIEAQGWRLESVGYVFVPTGQSSRLKMLGTGESVAVSGVVVGIYLFRASDLGSQAKESSV